MAGKFQVIAGKYDHNQEKDVKYISEELATMDEALAEAKLCYGYHFIDVEYTAPDDQVYLVSFEKIAKK